MCRPIYSPSLLLLGAPKSTRQAGENRRVTVIGTPTRRLEGREERSHVPAVRLSDVLGVIRNTLRWDGSRM